MDILNKQSWIADQEWSTSLRIWREDNNLGTGLIIWNDHDKKKKKCMWPDWKRVGVRKA